MSADMFEPVAGNLPTVDALSDLRDDRGLSAADDEFETVASAETPSIYMHATFIGGDPALARMRDVSITIPVLGVNDDISEYATIVSTVLHELVHLGNLASYTANFPTVVTGETP